MSHKHPHHRSHNRRGKSLRIDRYLVGIIGLVVILIFAAITLFADEDKQGNTLNRTIPNFTPQVQGAPRIEVAQDKLDYGDVAMNTTINTEFKVRNVGDQPLVVLGEPHIEVVEGCCPPRAMISSRTIAPGQEATLSMSFMMHAGMGGPHDFRVHLQTNDPVEPVKEMTVLSNWIE